MSSLSSRPSRSQHRRTAWRRVIFAVVALAMAGLIGYIAARGDRKAADGPPAAPPASALKTTGNYAEDWQTLCGPLLGDAQTECAKRLDAAYGRSDDAPVPPGK
jgi:hypothetical protein